MHPLGTCTLSASDVSRGRAPWPSLPRETSPCVRGRAALGPQAQDLATLHRVNPQPTSSRKSVGFPEISVFYGFSGQKRLFWAAMVRLVDFLPENQPFCSVLTVFACFDTSGTAHIATFPHNPVGIARKSDDCSCALGPLRLFSLFWQFGQGPWPCPLRFYFCPVKSSKTWSVSERSISEPWF